ncbi:CAMK/CAMKL/CHK1 protein kinase [Roridomyces roridus]|uniref:CAMK/CAMKL/CHK1 protein kinase n=1 Tax=Roridomyces roridus TaxID=1738132 RepID=A0AAD7BCP8_9AGAR|nr:CAMK/CAMKL/CHK1 protein kinase [Roridomyces roridus]
MPDYPTICGYQLVQHIGGGAFSKVFRAVNLKEHRVAACKVVAITAQTTDRERKTVQKEMRIQSQLQHEHILAFLNASIVELKHQDQFHPGFYMLLEFAGGGDLFDKIAPNVGVGDDIAHHYFSQLISGMDYMHKEGVCHRDLKPENVMLDAAGTLKISDFGLASVYKLKETGRTRTLSERCGSLPYAAPELEGQLPYEAEPIDVWGVGVILFTLLAGNTPWDEASLNSPEFHRYLTGEIFEEQPWSRFSSEALSLLQGLLTLDPRERFTLADAAAHPWCSRQRTLHTPAALAEALTKALKSSGDLEVASPDLASQQQQGDGDVEMLSAPRTQFTQTLMLFSQTQTGVRYTPHLTRFYASLPPAAFFPLLHQGLLGMDVQCRVAPPNTVSATPSLDASETQLQTTTEILRMRIGGHDARKEMFKGWLEVEPFEYPRLGVRGSFVIMQRDCGNPISWRQLWRSLIQCTMVEPHVLRK